MSIGKWYVSLGARYTLILQKNAYLLTVLTRHVKWNAFLTQFSLTFLGTGGNNTFIFQPNRRLLCRKTCVSFNHAHTKKCVSRRNTTRFMAHWITVVTSNQGGIYVIPFDSNKLIPVTKNAVQLVLINALIRNFPGQIAICLTCCGQDLILIDR